MVRYDQKIQRGLDLHSSSIIGVNDRLAFGPSIGGVRISTVIVVQKGIKRIGRV